MLPHTVERHLGQRPSGRPPNIVWILSPEAHRYLLWQLVCFHRSLRSKIVQLKQLSLSLKNVVHLDVVLIALLQNFLALKWPYGNSFNILRSFQFAQILAT